jgi:transposase
MEADEMIGKQERWQEDLFVAGPLRDLIPDDHVLKRVDKVLDLSWLREEVRDCYCRDNGRPGIDPEAAVRLMLAGLFEGIIHDRKLMRQAQVNLAIRWFAGYRLHEKLPDHSSLTRIRQRWGAERFKRIFQRTVQACCEAGLVNGETVHVDATLIRADVSWESLTERHAEKVLEANPTEDQPQDDPPKRKSGRPRTKAKAPKKYSPTDPDATLTTSSKEYRMEPSYKQHTAVDDLAGVVVDIDVTTGETSEGRQLGEQIKRVESNTGRKVKTVTADAGYAHSKNYMALENRRIDAVIPPQREAKRPKRIPSRRFKYDGRHKVVRCPGGKTLRRSSCDEKRWTYRARSSDCRNCPLRSRCLPPSAKVRTIMISHGHEALLRARRRKAKGWDAPTRRAYSRHRWRAEGVHGEAKKWHGLRRAHRRRLWNVQIQAYLTAAVMNLKRLAATGMARPAAKAAIQRSIAALLWLLRQLRSRLQFAEPHLLCRNRFRVSESTEPSFVRLAA